MKQQFKNRPNQNLCQQTLKMSEEQIKYNQTQNCLRCLGTWFACFEPSIDGLHVETLEINQAHEHHTLRLTNGTILWQEPYKDLMCPHPGNKYHWYVGHQLS